MLIKIGGWGRQTLEDFACAMLGVSAEFVGSFRAMAFRGRLGKMLLGCGCGPVP